MLLSELKCKINSCVLVSGKRGIPGALGDWMHDIYGTGSYGNGLLKYFERSCKQGTSFTTVLLFLTLREHTKFLRYKYISLIGKTSYDVTS